MHELNTATPSRPSAGEGAGNPTAVGRTPTAVLELPSPTPAAAAAVVSAFAGPAAATSTPAPEPTQPFVVLDIGSTLVRAGVGESDSDTPPVVFESVTGVPRAYFVHTLRPGPDSPHVGGSLPLPRSQMKLSSPIVGGCVKEYDGLFRLIRHALLVQLGIDPSEHVVVLADSIVHGPNLIRGDVLRVLFDDLDAPAVLLVDSAVAALLASGRTSGLVVDSSAARTRIVAVVESCALPASAREVAVGGATVTEALRELLDTHHGVRFNTAAQVDGVDALKRSACYVAQDAAVEAAKPAEEVSARLELPDGQEVELTAARYRPAEEVMPAIADAVVASLRAVGAAERGTVAGSVVLAGGNSLLPGFRERLEADVAAGLQAAGEGARVKVIAEPGREHGAWAGASIVGALSLSRAWDGGGGGDVGMLVTRTEYEELGTTGVLKRLKQLP
jgi:actin-related protein